MYLLRWFWLDTFAKFHVGSASKYETSSLVSPRLFLTQTQSFKSEGDISWFQENLPTTDSLKLLAATQLSTNNKNEFTNNNTNNTRLN